MFKTTPLIALVLCAAAGGALAEPAPAKKALIQRILQIQQPGIESLARTLAEQPAAEILDRAGAALPARVPAERREAVAKQIEADAQKYVQEAVPIVRARALQLAPSTVGAVLDEKFSEDELKQVVAMMESPVYTKFQSLGGPMQKALAEKLVAETRSQVAPKVRAMEDAIAGRLGVTAGAAPAAAKK